jgi:predicted GNAT superfamily acetyltransferase
MMGVDPGCQGEGIGYQLKLAQREFALAWGLDLVTWTYDPLESRNAYLNVHKLGGVCQAYIRDYYGPLDDGLNYGLPTDRFQVDWWIAGDRVEKHLAGQVGERVSSSAVVVNATGYTRSGLMTPGLLRLDAGLPTIHVETPADYQAIKAADAELALEWRLAMRQVFEAYFVSGYTVVDFLSLRTDSGRRSLYVLRAD